MFDNKELVEYKVGKVTRGRDQHEGCGFKRSRYQSRTQIRISTILFRSNILLSPREHDAI